MNDYSDDDEFEQNDDSNEALGANAKIKQLREQLKEAQQKRDEYLAGWQREKADAINSRKEALADGDRRAAREKMSLIEDLIPVLDSFDMAAGSESWSEVSDGFRTGMEAVRNQLLDVLSRNGVERYGKVGEQFNPRTEEAVQEVSDAPGEPHSVVRVLRYGYKMGDRIIRPAQVIVKSA
ncbi:nucleotide exchange factor GrpE [Candidatus Parcubacteria bacterium]|nr:MAG: nucleotide exchange factor GrpE [Candidatus Parcubacteria bacterium]